MATKLVIEAKKVELSNFKTRILTIIVSKLHENRTHLNDLSIDLASLATELKTDLGLESIGETETLEVVRNIFENLEFKVCLGGHNNHLVLIKIAPKTEPKQINEKLTERQIDRAGDIISQRRGSFHF